MCLENVQEFFDAARRVTDGPESWNDSMYRQPPDLGDDGFYRIAQESQNVQSEPGFVQTSRKTFLDVWTKVFGADTRNVFSGGLNHSGFAVQTL